jgi:hypothetical protein
MSNYTSLEELVETLSSNMPDQRWRAIMEVLAIKGIADTRQLQDATGFGRDKVVRVLDRLAGLYLDGAPMISKLMKTIGRPGEAKRPPAIYVLAEGGARLLRHLGFSDTHAFGLVNDEKAIAHVLSMTGLHLIAKSSGVHITTDQNISYGAEQVLRPDHRVNLPDGKCFLIEVEQRASMKLVDRIKESLTHHQAFFASEEARHFLKEVRMLVNGKPGREFDNTLKVWQAAMLQVENEFGTELNFQLMALPLQIFMSSPEWHEALSNAWVRVDAEGANTSPVLMQTSEMPSAVRLYTSLMGDDIVLLEALAQVFIETTGENLRRPNREMFAVVRTIYAASFRGKGWASYEGSAIGEEWTIDEAAGLPVVSIYLLREYLNLHRDLRKGLNQAMHFNRGRMVWTQQNILHRMGIVIRKFMSYYGWRPSDFLMVHPMISDNESKDYTVKCEFEYKAGGMDYGEQIRIQKALTWVLLALFEYGQDIGLGRPEFW